MPLTNPDLAKVFGKPTPPPGIDIYNTAAPGSVGGAGLFIFIANLLKVVISVASIYSLINLLVSGIQYVGSTGKPDIVKQLSSRIWMSLLGLTIVGASLVIGAILGLIFFKDPTIFINPLLPTPQ